MEMFFMFLCIYVYGAGIYSVYGASDGMSNVYDAATDMTLPVSVSGFSLRLKPFNEIKHHWWGVEGQNTKSQSGKMGV